MTIIIILNKSCQTQPINSIVRHTYYKIITEELVVVVSSPEILLLICFIREHCSEWWNML